MEPIKNIETKKSGGYWLPILSTLGIFAVSYIFYKMWFLRVPARKIPVDDSVFVSPANGKIIAIKKIDTSTITETKDSPLTERGAIKILATDVAPSVTIISIMLQITDVHYQRACTSGIVLETKYTKGNKDNAIMMPDEQFSRYENEHNEVLIQMDTGLKYKVVQIAGFVARQIECYVKPDQHVNQGQVLGVIKFGSQVTVVLPSSVNVVANVGDYLIDGETIIAKL
jgi:phosphatidylserine decarboxylase